MFLFWASIIYFCLGALLAIIGRDTVKGNPVVFATVMIAWLPMGIWLALNQKDEDGIV